MSQAPLAQSADKKELFARLNLTEQVHRMLLDDAQIARDTLSRDPLNLTEHSKADSAVLQPYKWDEISETAKHRESLATVRSADQLKRHYYNLGRYRTNVNEENWVARWYLWHSFRYRDNRDSRSKVASSTSTSAAAGNSKNNGNSFWDPVHGCWR